jgi:hypothetical protein
MGLIYVFGDKNYKYEEKYYRLSAIYLLPPSVRGQWQWTICYIKTKEKNQIMNSQRTKQHICKLHKPTHDQSLQKSSFLADTL